MRAQVCDFSLEWTPGSRLQYHGRAAHLVQAMVIEAVTGQDFRDVIRERVIEPLGLGNDIFVGVPEAQQTRCADTYGPEKRDNSAAFRAAGLPNGGGYATARGMAAFYQMLGHGGRLDNVRLFSPRLIAYVSRSHTGESPDHAMTGIPMHRGLGPHVRGDSDRIRGLGTIGRAGDVRARRRRVVVFLGGPKQRGFVHLPDQFRQPGPVAFGAPGPGRQPGACGDRLTVFAAGTRIKCWKALCEAGSPGGSASAPDVADAISQSRNRAIFGAVGGRLGCDDIVAGVLRQHRVERRDQAAGGEIRLHQLLASQSDAEAFDGRLDRHEAQIERQAPPGRDRVGQTRGGQPQAPVVAPGRRVQQGMMGEVRRLTQRSAPTQQARASRLETAVRPSASARATPASGHGHSEPRRPPPPGGSPPGGWRS